MVAAIDWEPIADHLGFGSLKEMWETLYDENNQETGSLRKLEKYLGVSQTAITRGLIKAGIEIRDPSTYLCSRKGKYFDKTNQLLERREVLKDLKVTQIVVRFGLKSRDQFYAIARRHGLEWKKRGYSGRSDN
jgi:hypothetical protein